jgi:hypothetical protein
MPGYRESGIEIVRGDTAFLDGTVAIAGVAQPITGWTFWFTAKRRLTDADAAAVFQKTTAGGGVVVTDAAGGLFYIALEPADTSSLPAAAVKLYGDCQGKDTGGNIYTLDRLLFTIGPDATESTS